MPEPKKMIISASRRTDIPAFYSDWLISVFEKGYAEVPNPINKKIYKIPLTDIHSLVLWSKNFAPLLEKIDRLKPHQLFFMFTVNDSKEQEANVPPLSDRFDQIDFIVKKFGVKRLFIRFDPIAHWQDSNGIHNNLASFDIILKKAAKVGVSKIITSFMNTSYRKLKNRPHQFIDIPTDDKIGLTDNLAKKAEKMGIKLAFCCNDYLFLKQSLLNVEKASCIDGHYIANETGEPAILRKDYGQRKGCGCTYSRDIGSYEQICYHNCSYCYANPGS